MDDEDDDIFHMLLKETGKKTKNINQSRQTTSRQKPSNDLIDSDGSDIEFPFDLKFSMDPTFSQSSTKIESEGMILEYVYQQSFLVLDHCCDEGFLYILIDMNNEALIQIYPLDCSKTSKPSPTILLTSMKSSIFQTTDNDRPESRHLYVVNHHSTSETADPVPGHACCSVDSGNICIPSSTFASLFGKTAGLVRSSVILLCTNDGQVYWRPLKSVGQEGKFFPLCQLHDAVNSVLFVSVKKKSSSDDEAVTRTLCSAMMMGFDGPDNGSVAGLLAVNPIGECCLLLPTPRRPPCEQLPLRFCLPHSVVCCIQMGQQFIYSTGCSVESATLCLKQDDSLPVVTLENCTTLMMTKIERLFWKTSQNDSNPRLMGLTSDLDMIGISTSSSSNTPTHPSPAIQLLPDTIQQIQKQNSTIQTLQTQSNDLDSILTQLNFFANLYQQYQKKTSGHEKLRPLIHCEYNIDYIRKYEEKSDIKIHLRNDSHIDLSNSWTVLVTVIPQYSVLDKVFTDTFCFKMEKGFHSGTYSDEYSIPIPDCVGLNPLSQLKICVSLILHVSQKDVNHSSVTNLPKGKSDDVLEVEIGTHKFDILSFLRPSIDVASSICPCTGYSINEMRTILEKLSARQLEKKKNENNAVIVEKEKIVSKMMVTDLVDLELNFIIKEELVRLLITNIRLYPDDEDTPMLYESPGGSEILFKVEGSEVTPTVGQKKSLQLRLESCDVFLLCVVHIALLDQFKAMLKDRRKTPLTKTDWEKQLCALRAVYAGFSNKNVKDDEMISSLCKVLDCLGLCIV